MIGCDRLLAPSLGTMRFETERLLLRWPLLSDAPDLQRILISPSRGLFLTSSGSSGRTSPSGAERLPRCEGRRPVAGSASNRHRQNTGAPPSMGLLATMTQRILRLRIPHRGEIAQRPRIPHRSDHRRKRYRIRTTLNSISGSSDACSSFSAMRAVLDHWRRSSSTAVTGNAAAAPTNAAAPIRTSRRFNFSDIVLLRFAGDHTNKQVASVIF